MKLPEAYSLIRQMDHDFQQDRESFESYGDVLKKHIPTREKALEFVKVIETCKCCPAHQVRRPTAKEFEEGHQGKYPLRCDFCTNKCWCPCRSTVRSLCGVWNDKE